MHIKIETLVSKLSMRHYMRTHYQLHSKVDCQQLSTSSIKVLGGNGAFTCSIKRLCEEDWLHEELQASHLVYKQGAVSISRRVIYILLQECLKTKKPHSGLLIAFTYSGLSSVSFICLLWKFS